MNSAYRPSSPLAPRATSCLTAIAILGFVFAPGCDDDGSSGGDGDGSAGSGGTIGAGDAGTGGTSSGGAGGVGQGGASGGAGGALAGGAGGAGGAAADPNNVTCGSLPKTLMFGPTIQLDGTGVVLCIDPANPAMCRLTNNTYSDGPQPCPSPQGAPTHVALFISRYAPSAGAANFSANTSSTSGWTITTASHGKIENQNLLVSAIPVDTDITFTMMFKGGTYTLKFKLVGASIAIASFVKS